MQSVFPLDVHRLREFCTATNEDAVNVQTQPAEAEDTDSNEIDLTPRKPPMTVAACKFRGKLESLWRESFEFLVIGTLATITKDQKEFLRPMCVAHQRKVPESES